MDGEIPGNVQIYPMSTDYRHAGAVPYSAKTSHDFTGNMLLRNFVGSEGRLLLFAI